MKTRSSDLRVASKTGVEAYPWWRYVLALPVFLVGLALLVGAGYVLGRPVPAAETRTPLALACLVAAAAFLQFGVLLVYTWASQDGVQEMRRQREALHRPICIFAGPRVDGGVGNILNINLAGPPALNVRAWCLQPDGQFGAMQDAHYIPSGHPHNVNEESWRNTSEIWIRYDDAEGRPYQTHRDNSGKWSLTWGEAAWRNNPINALDPLYPSVAQ